MLRNVTTALVALLIAVAPSARAQSSRPQFEVASVKPNNLPGARDPFDNGACAGGIPKIEPRRFAASTTVYSLISWAYGLDCPGSEQHNLIIGKADWVRKDLFAIDAVIPEGAPFYTVQQLQDGDAQSLQHLIENLLVDRFKLQLHSENREMPIYRLTTATGGYKLQPFIEGSCFRPPAPLIRSAGDQKPACDFSVQVMPGRPGRRKIVANGVGITKFAQLLGLDLDRPVIDQTGITGLFDFRLDYSFVPASAVTVPTVDTGGTASIFTALQEQLGLKLESARGSVEVLVIDSVSKPTEN